MICTSLSQIKKVTNNIFGPQLLMSENFNPNVIENLTQFIIYIQLIFLACERNSVKKYVLEIQIIIKMKMHEIFETKMKTKTQRIEETLERISY